MTEISFKKSQADDCLYILRAADSITLLVLVYVDDIAVAGHSLSQIEDFKCKFQECFNITDLGELKYIFGIQIGCNREARTTLLNQTAYIHQILTQFGMQDCTLVTTPLAVKYNLSVTQSPTTEEELTEYLRYASSMSYLEIIGSLLYMTQTRPDIQFAISIISQFGGNPGRPHLEAAKHVLHYLQGTAHLTLILGRRKRESIDLIGWTDSNWAQDLDSRRLVGGFIFDIADGTISWSSKKQPTVALSTVEAEYMAASNVTKEAIWLRTLLEDLGHPPVAATILHADNQGCIALAQNPVTHTRAKHIDIHHHFIHECVDRGKFDLQYCNTKDMLI